MMPDREKAIAELANIAKCLYPYIGSNQIRACLDAIELLREQEAVTPRWTHPEVDKSVLMCGGCGIEIPLGKPRYCPWCGRAVKWDG